MNTMPIRRIRDEKLTEKIAKACGIKRQAVSQWKQVPPRRVKKVAAILGVPEHEVYPDYLAPRLPSKVKKRNGAT